MIPDARCASLAALGSLISRSPIVLVVNILSSEGWRIVLVGICCVAESLSGAPLAYKDMFAADSTSAVVFIPGGLAQSGLEINVVC